MPFLGRCLTLALYVALQLLLDQSPAQNLTNIAERPANPPIVQNWILPCGEDYLLIVQDGQDTLWTLEQWVLHWRGWIERYRERGNHDVPLEIALAVIMHESRGNPQAESVAGAVGLFQVMPGEVIPGNPSQDWLRTTSHNMQYGLDILEAYTWEGSAYAGDWEKEYRETWGEAIEASSDLDWWYSEAGHATLAMYHCGPNRYSKEWDCGVHGGAVYADDVLTCWVPWVERILEQ